MNTKETYLADRRQQRHRRRPGRRAARSRPSPGLSARRREPLGRAGRALAAAGAAGARRSHRAGRGGRHRRADRRRVARAGPWRSSTPAPASTSRRARLPGRDGRAGGDAPTCSPRALLRRGGPAAAAQRAISRCWSGWAARRPILAPAARRGLRRLQGRRCAICSRSLRVDLAAEGIAVSVVSPGFVDTPLTRTERLRHADALAGRQGRPAHRRRPRQPRAGNRLPAPFIALLLLLAHLPSRLRLAVTWRMSRLTLAKDDTHENRHRRHRHRRPDLRLPAARQH